MNDKLKNLKRSFNAKDYLQKKVDAINNFSYENNLDAAVIGLSGGVDSALVFKLLKEASIQPKSPLKKVYPIIALIYGNGTSGQNQSEHRAFQLIEDGAQIFKFF